jgi:uncharacterized tellurite resistance protein B-like protein
MVMTEDPTLNRAIIQLLLQVAWADHEISETEVAHLLGLADRAELAADEIAELRACLAGEKPLPTPDLGLLREHKKKVLLAVGSLMTADDSIASEEREVFDQIREMLG